MFRDNVPGCFRYYKNNFTNIDKFSTKFVKFHFFNVFLRARAVVGSWRFASLNPSGWCLTPVHKADVVGAPCK